MEAKHIAIIGGGASGLTAAITAAREGARAVIFEGNDRVGKKLLMTGNGKCNLTNLSYTEQEYFSSTPELLSSFLELKDPEKVMDFLNSTGLFLMQKEWRIYPLSEQASSVLEKRITSVTAFLGKSYHSRIFPSTGTAVTGIGDRSSLARHPAHRHWSRCCRLREEETFRQL